MFSNLISKISPPKKALILQSDWEGGMCKVARDLIDNGTDVTKILFSLSDKLYHLKGINTVSYKAPLLEFKSWLKDYVKEHKIDTLILYNQHRPYNAIGWDLAEEMDLECLVLELGLLRPDFTTIYSRKTEPFQFYSKWWETIQNTPIEELKPITHRRTARSDSTIKLVKMGFWVLICRLSMLLGSYKFFIDQRKLGIRHHLSALFFSLYRYYRRGYQKEMKGAYWQEYKDTYYIAPLQVHCDSQITLKSEFVTMEQFIEKVAKSFLDNAPKDKKLVFKVHPMDRGYKDYAPLIANLNRSCGTERFLYLDRIHLPSALKNATGCVTINSSVGISSLIHTTPTLCLGQAVYDLPDLTYQGGLDSFWMEHTPVDPELVDKFVNSLKETNQAQGVLYQDIFKLKSEAKIHWTPLFKELFTHKRKANSLQLNYESTTAQSSYSTTTDAY